MNFFKYLSVPVFLISLISCSNTLKENQSQPEFNDKVISQQRDELEKNTDGKGFGPQSPRNIDVLEGTNPILFGHAPSYKKMNLCNIHFHKFAEHKGGEFTKFAGPGNGQGKNTGYQYSGKISQKEITQVEGNICPGKYGSLNAGDTIELHYVHSTAQVTPGPTLGACLSDSIKNPQLRVEAQVYVLVNDRDSANFTELTKVGQRNGYQQALNIPHHTGRPIEYAGSTTGPSYNTQGSPFQVTWSVRPKVMKVDLKSVKKWCEGNIFKEDHAHGVRNLVINPKLLSSDE